MRSGSISSGSAENKRGCGGHVRRGHATFRDAETVTPSDKIVAARSQVSGSK